LHASSAGIHLAAGISQIGLRQLQGDSVLGRVDFKQGLSCLYRLIVLDPYLSYDTRDFGCHADHITLHPRLRREGGETVGE
jgi:hypothetical protein